MQSISKRKIIVAAGVGGALVAAGAYAYVSHSRRAVAPVACDQIDPPPRIVAFGDSLVVGYGAPQGQGFVDVLSASAGVPIENRGTNGDTTADGLRKLQSVIGEKPDVVLLLLGGNDAIQKIPQTVTQNNLSQMIEQLQAAHVQVVLLGVTGGLFSDPYRKMYDALAAKYKLAYVTNVLDGIISKADLMSDVVHPNAAGYAKIAQKAMPALRQACAAYAQASAPSPSK